MSRGHIRRRGEGSWELKFDDGNDAGGKRRIRYVSFKGTKKEAQTKLAELIAAVGKGSYVEPIKSIVADFVRARVNQWEAAGNISARTAQRYRQLVENQIVPHLGAKLVQRLALLDIEGWHDFAEWAPVGQERWPRSPRVGQSPRRRGARRYGGQERMQGPESAQGCRR
jgi:hypothetical protein